MSVDAEPFCASLVRSLAPCTKRVCFSRHSIAPPFCPDRGGRARVREVGRAGKYWKFSTSTPATQWPTLSHVSTRPPAPTQINQPDEGIDGHRRDGNDREALTRGHSGAITPGLHRLPRAVALIDAVLHSGLVDGAISPGSTRPTSCEVHRRSGHGGLRPRMGCREPARPDRERARQPLPQVLRPPAPP